MTRDSDRLPLADSRSKKSLAIGPLNTAGQAREWSEAARRNLGIPAVSFAPSGQEGGITGSVHKSRPRWLPRRRFPPLPLRRLCYQKILRDSSLLLDESLMPLYDTFSHYFSAHEVQSLRRRGITIGVVFHGDDIRNHELHAQRVAGSYVLELDSEYRNRLDSNSKKRRGLARELGIPIYVSTPDLALEVPESVWLPLAVQPKMWESGRGVLEGSKPRVLFRPTSPLKGTSVVVPVLEDLERRGLIEFIHPTVVSHEQMPDLYRSVDVVVDQIRTGSYGVAAVEAMSAGRLCVGFLSDEVRNFMSKQPPVVDASVETFEETMERILVDREHYSELASQGPDFVREQHDGRASAQVLREFLSQDLRQD